VPGQPLYGPARAAGRVAQAVPVGGRTLWDCHSEPSAPGCWPPCGTRQH